MTTIFTQNFTQDHFEFKFCEFARLVTIVIFFSAWDKSHDSTAKSKNKNTCRPGEDLLPTHLLKNVLYLKDWDEGFTQAEFFLGSS